MKTYNPKRSTGNIVGTTHQMRPKQPKRKRGPHKLLRAASGFRLGDILAREFELLSRMLIHGSRSYGVLIHGGHSSSKSSFVQMAANLEGAH